MKAFIFDLWLIYSAFEGQREAYYYHVSNNAIDKLKNIHYMYAIQRLIVLVIIGLFTGSVIYPFSLAMIFPFIHDGYYYVTRNKLNPGIYKKGFMDDSTHSEALLELDYNQRVIMFAFGIAYLILHTQLSGG